MKYTWKVFYGVLFAIVLLVFGSSGCQTILNPSLDICDNPNPDTFENGYTLCDGKIHYVTVSMGSKYHLSTRVNSVLEDADVASFKILKNKFPEENLPLLADAKDRNNIYRGVSIVFPEADAPSFELLQRPYSKGKNRVFYFYDEIENADPNSFEILTNGYSKDRFNVYYLGEAVKYAKASSFKVVGKRSGKDDIRVFYENKLISGADPLTFEHISPSYTDRADPGVKNVNTFYRDKNNYYVNDRILGPVELVNFDLIIERINTHAWHYQNMIQKVTKLHRTTKWCANQTVLDEETELSVKYTGGEYTFYCKNSFVEKCLEDESFDVYFDEWCEDDQGKIIRWERS
jgi:hypothetical protein